MIYDYEIWEDGGAMHGMTFKAGFNKGDPSRFGEWTFNDQIALKEFHAYCATHRGNRRPLNVRFVLKIFAT